MARPAESDGFLILITFILFLLINFNLEIGIIYGFMAFIGWQYYNEAVRGNFDAVPIERPGTDRMASLVVAAGVYIAFIFLASFITTRVDPNAILEFDSNFAYISFLVAVSFSATPILSGSKFLRHVVWGVLIPIIETKTFFRSVFQWAVHFFRLKFPTNIFSSTALIVSSAIGFAFALFHILAKGITSNSALLVTFLFGFVSVEMVIFFKQALEAIFLHIITNTIATMQQLGNGFFSVGATGFEFSGIVLLGSSLLISWFILFQEFPFITPARRVAA